MALSERTPVAPTAITVMAQVPPYFGSDRTSIRMKGGVKQTAFFPVIGQVAQSFRIHNTYLKPWIISDPDEEYEAITAAVGLLDVTGEEVVEVAGPDATRLMERLVVRNVTKMRDGTCRYTVMCYDSGGIVEDAVLAKFGPDRYWWVGGPATAEQWIFENSRSLDVTVRSYLDRIHVASLQGPASRAILQNLCDIDLDKVRYYGLVPVATVAGVQTTITRTGFTAELGFDIYVDVSDAVALFKALLNAGCGEGLKMCGSCALDRRRVEAGIINVGQDFDWATNPFEVGLGWMVDFAKPEFLGRDSLQAAANAGVKRRLVGLRAPFDRPLERATPVFANGRIVGTVTSSAVSPAVGASLGMAIVACEASGVGERLVVGEEPEAVEVEIVKMPFLDANRDRAKA
jgi:aminomethyltransferase